MQNKLRTWNRSHYTDEGTLDLPMWTEN